jgi:L-threonylcarbamoyladenylate synthase
LGTGQAIAALREGLLVGVPTETVYGLASLPTDDALERLLEAKARSPQKGIALLVDDLEQVSSLASVTDVARRLADRFWPGPLTLVLPCARDDVSPLLTGGRGTLAFRLPDHHVPRALARTLGPLALTSANRSGERDALTADELLAAVGEAIEVVLDDGPVSGGVPSTIVAVGAGADAATDPAMGSSTDEPRLLRPGAVPWEAVLAALDRPMRR